MAKSYTTPILSASDLSELEGIITEYGAAHLIAVIMEQERAYHEILGAIQHGAGRMRRDEPENAAEILDELRDAYKPDAAEIADRSHTLCGVAHLIAEAERICKQINRE